MYSVIVQAKVVINKTGKTFAQGAIHPNCNAILYVYISCHRRNEKVVLIPLMCRHLKTLRLVSSACARDTGNSRLAGFDNALNHSRNLSTVKD